MKFLKLILLVLILQVNNSFCNHKGNISVYSNGKNEQQINKVLINDTVIIKYSFNDSLQAPLIIKIQNATYTDELKCRKNNGQSFYPFTLDVTNFNPQNKAIVNVNIILEYNDSVLDKETIKLVYRPLELLTLARQPAVEAKLTEKLYLRSHMEWDYNGHNIYINEIPVDKLKKDKTDKNLYYFFVHNRLANNDSLTQILNPRCHSQIDVALAIGTNYENKETLKSKFSLIFDENKGSRKHFSIISFIIILIIILYVLFKNKASILRVKSECYKYAPFSLARTQMAFWTIIIAIAFFVVWYNTGKLISITTDVLVLLGISAGTTLGATLIDKSDSKNKKRKIYKEKVKSNQFLLNILSDSKGLSIHRFQNVVFTIAIGCYFLYEVFKEFRIPDLDTNLMVLMGISSGAYLAIKKGENDDVQEDANGQLQPETVAETSQGQNVALTQEQTQEQQKENNENKTEQNNNPDKNSETNQK